MFTESPTDKLYNPEIKTALSDLPSPTNILNQEEGHTNWNWLNEIGAMRTVVSYPYEKEVCFGEYCFMVQDKSQPVYENQTNVLQVQLELTKLVSELKEERKKRDNCWATGKDFMEVKNCIAGIGL